MNLGKRNIIWIASYPKSGNTWFRILLANYLSESKDPININQINHSFIASNRSIFDSVIGVNSSDLLEEEIRALRPQFYRSISNESESTVFIKVHDAWEKNHLNEPLFPQDVTKGVVYLIRHPLDVAVSFAYHEGISFQQSLLEIDDLSKKFCRKKEKLHNQLTQNLLTWSNHVTSWVDNSNLPVHIIRYEDMLNNTYLTFSSAIKFLDLEYSESMIKKAIRFSDFREVKKQEELNGFKEKPMNLEKFFRSGSSGNWKKHYRKEHVLNFRDNNSTLLERFNYNI